MNNKTRNRPSIWLILQTGIAVAGVVALSIGLYRFIQAATLPTSVRSIVGATGQPPLLVPEPAPQQDVAPQPESDTLVLPAMTAEAGATLTFAAMLDPEAEDLPRSVSRRVQWRLFQKSSEGRWTAFAPSRLGLEFWTATTQIAAPGEYLLGIALPPVDLKALDGRDSAYVARFLEGRAARQCRMIRIAITGNPAQEGKQPAVQPFANPPAGLVLFRIAQQPIPPPPPPQPPVPSPATKSEEDNKTIDPEAEQESESVPDDRQPPDKRMQKHGETNTIETVTKENTEAESTAKPRQNGVRHPPLTDQPPAVDFAEEPLPEPPWEGNLPETVLRYDPSEFATLSLKQWKAIQRKYQMPFLAVPSRSFYAEVGGCVVLHQDDSTKRVMSPDEFKRAYGPKYLPLADFSKEVRNAVQERFNDPLLWYKCQELQGFLLNNLLLGAIFSAFEEHNITLEEQQSIRSIEVSLNVSHTDDGTASIVTRIGKINREK